MTDGNLSETSSRLEARRCDQVQRAAKRRQGAFRHLELHHASLSRLQHEGGTRKLAVLLTLDQADHLAA
jgi:hypothetical protein